MKYGINGNTNKQQVWEAVAALLDWLLQKEVAFCLHKDVAEGLRKRQLASPEVCTQFQVDDLAEEADVIISFGGDGTMLRSAHEVGTRGTPILGVNVGRLGFLADIEVTNIHAAIECLEDGKYRIEPRMVLEAELADGPGLTSSWALNEFVIDRSGPAGLISIDVVVDGVPLNNYWADGLIIATPTGSTAYSLAVGSPIIKPGADVLILTPIAPHSLTVRPIVLPASSLIEARVRTQGKTYLLAADGASTMLDQEDIPITIRRAEHAVNLVKLEGQNYFKTIRSKLMWGAGGAVG